MECKKCIYFRENVHLGRVEPHHCEAFGQPLGSRTPADCPVYVKAKTA